MGTYSIFGLNERIVDGDDLNIVMFQTDLVNLLFLSLTEAFDEGTRIRLRIAVNL